MTHCTASALHSTRTAPFLHRTAPFLHRTAILSHDARDPLDVCFSYRSRSTFQPSAISPPLRAPAAKPTTSQSAGFTIPPAEIYFTSTASAMPRATDTPLGLRACWTTFPRNLHILFGQPPQTLAPAANTRSANINNLNHVAKTMMLNRGVLNFSKDALTGSTHRACAGPALTATRTLRPRGV